MAKKQAEKTKKSPASSLAARGKMIEPLDLKSARNVADFIEKVFAASGYNARRLGEACAIARRMVENDATICLTIAGAMTPIGMSGPFIDLMKNGFVDFIVATGANLYHDLHRAYAYPMTQGDFRADDGQLLKKGIARIYDVYIQDDETMLPTDLAILKMLSRNRDGLPMSTADLHYRLGRDVLREAPNPEKSFLACAAKYNVPIYTPSPGDSSIGMNLLVPHFFDRPVNIDPLRDILETSAFVREATKNGAVILGGGSPKNFYLQTQPTLWQILMDNQGGHDYFIQLTVDSPQWGGLSGATPSEAKSWGKVKDVEINSSVVYSCTSITFPLLAQYMLTTLKPKKRKELMKNKNAMADSLLERCRKNKKFRDHLARTGLTFRGVEGKRKTGPS